MHFIDGLQVSQLDKEIDKERPLHESMHE